MSLPRNLRKSHCYENYTASGLFCSIMYTLEISQRRVYAAQLLVVRIWMYCLMYKSRKCVLVPDKYVSKLDKSINNCHRIY